MQSYAYIIPTQQSCQQPILWGSDTIDNVYQGLIFGGSIYRNSLSCGHYGIRKSGGACM